MSNPFETNVTNHQGERCQWQDVESRLAKVQNFTIQQCWDAIERRMRKLDPKGEYIPF